ncbi:hypothetical protein SNEBB_009906 [Seison nebaliae]|nr:hypothetical protein SNEBB_009906 [Seison nebaliae]
MVNGECDNAVNSDEDYVEDVIDDSSFLDLGGEDDEEYEKEEEKMMGVYGKMNDNDWDNCESDWEMELKDDDEYIPDINDIDYDDMDDELESDGYEKNMKRTRIIKGELGQLLKNASSAFENNKLDLVLKLCSRALQLDSSNYSVLQLLSETYRKKGDHVSANQYKLVAAIQNEDSEFLYNLADQMKSNMQLSYFNSLKAVRFARHLFSRYSIRLLANSSNRYFNVYESLMKIDGERRRSSLKKKKSLLFTTFSFFLNWLNALKYHCKCVDLTRDNLKDLQKTILILFNSIYCRLPIKFGIILNTNNELNELLENLSIPHNEKGEEKEIVQNENCEEFLEHFRRLANEETNECQLNRLRQIIPNILHLFHILTMLDMDSSDKHSFNLSNKMKNCFRMKCYDMNDSSFFASYRTTNFKRLFNRLLKKFHIILLTFIKRTDVIFLNTTPDNVRLIKLLINLSEYVKEPELLLNYLIHHSPFILSHQLQLIKKEMRKKRIFIKHLPTTGKKRLNDLFYLFMKKKYYSDISKLNFHENLTNNILIIFSPFLNGEQTLKMICLMIKNLIQINGNEEWIVELMRYMKLRMSNILNENHLNYLLKHLISKFHHLCHVIRLHQSSDQINSNTSMEQMDNMELSLSYKAIGQSLINMATIHPIQFELLDQLKMEDCSLNGELLKLKKYLNELLPICFNEKINQYDLWLLRSIVQFIENNLEETIVSLLKLFVLELKELESGIDHLFPLRNFDYSPDMSQYRCRQVRSQLLYLLRNYFRDETIFQLFLLTLFHHPDQFKKLRKPYFSFQPFIDEKKKKKKKIMMMMMMMMRERLNFNDEQKEIIRKLLDELTPILLYKVMILINYSWRIDMLSWKNEEVNLRKYLVETIIQSSNRMDWQEKELLLEGMMSMFFPVVFENSICLSQINGSFFRNKIHGNIEMSSLLYRSQLTEVMPTSFHIRSFLDYLKIILPFYRRFHISSSYFHQYIRQFHSLTHQFHSLTQLALSFLPTCNVSGINRERYRSIKEYFVAFFQNIYDNESRRFILGLMNDVISLYYYYGGEKNLNYFHLNRLLIICRSFSQLVEDGIFSRVLLHFAMFTIVGTMNENDKLYKNILCLGGGYSAELISVHVFRIWRYLYNDTILTGHLTPYSIHWFIRIVRLSKLPYFRRYVFRLTYRLAHIQATSIEEHENRLCQWMNEGKVKDDELHEQIFHLVDQIQRRHHSSLSIFNMMKASEMLHAGSYTLCEETLQYADIKSLGNRKNLIAPSFRYFIDFMLEQNRAIRHTASSDSYGANKYLISSFMKLIAYFNVRNNIRTKSVGENTSFVVNGARERFDCLFQQESLFNVGRFMQQMDVTSDALQYYTRILQQMHCSCISDKKKCHQSLCCCSPANIRQYDTNENESFCVMSRCFPPSMFNASIPINKYEMNVRYHHLHRSDECSSNHSFHVTTRQSPPLVDDEQVMEKNVTQCYSLVQESAFNLSLLLSDESHTLRILRKYLIFKN